MASFSLSPDTPVIALVTDAAEDATTGHKELHIARVWKIPVGSADTHLQAFAEEIAAADTMLRAGGSRKRASKVVDECAGIRCTPEIRGYPD